MNKESTLLWKIDAALAFVDLKIGLLVWILFDFYRNTALLSSAAGINKEKASTMLHDVWIICGSPYIIWIPIVAVADIAVKRVVKAMME